MANDAGTGATDLGRRITEQREKAGLSREDAAQRAGMSDVYLGYLETSSSSNPTHATLTRLEAALNTAPGALSGAGMNLPPGQRGAARNPVLEDLAPEECKQYVAPGGVGRFLFVDETRGPILLPVNYRMDGDDVVFRTDSQEALAEGVHKEKVSFDVDHIDDALGEGWAVLMSGTAHLITDPAELARAKALGIEPWAGDVGTYVSVVPDQITGRRIRMTG